MPDKMTVDLSNCDREPIHIPGSIQPLGCLIACDVSGAVITRHSANAGEMFQTSAEINGSRLDEVIGGEAAHTLRNALATSDDPSRAALRMGVRINDGPSFDVSVHRVESAVIMEFQPAAEHSDQPLETARMLISRIRNISRIDQLIEKSTRLMAAMLGYDRVMVYRFEQDGAGQVVSEYKRRDLESFKGQYFPATDIPKQARMLYLRNTIRIISDAEGHRVPIVPSLDEAGLPLDLSFAHLRSVSPIHCEYLRNMGVGASMSISIVLNGELWGLIACHHYSPKALSMTQRVAAEMFGEFLSMHLSALQQKQILDKTNEARRFLDKFLQTASHHTDLGALLRLSVAEFKAMMACDGIGLWLDGVWTSSGMAPPEEAILALADGIGANGGNRIWASHNLVTEIPSAADYAESVCGVLAIPVSQRPRDYLFFFRREMVQTLNWAGNPEKSYESGPLGDRLTPRKSFAIWKETVHLHSQPWTEDEQEIAEAIRAVLVEIVLHHNEILADERGKADVRQRMLNEELNHRVKNILAVIKALIGHPVQEGRNLQDYIATLKGRIQALAFAHDQVVRGGDGGTLHELLEAELKPYRDGTRAVTLLGPYIWLDSRSFSVMALVLHEMATNAAKYGSLSAARGRLDVNWQRLDNGDCQLTWSESHGPAVVPPKRAGFGTVLIERSVPFELGGKSNVEYAADGVHARFLIPAQHIPSSETDVIPELLEQAAEQQQTAPALMSELDLLLVEDQMLVAADVEIMLADHGIDKVTTVPSASEALRRLRDFTPDVAILDVNLGSETSLPVAEELTRRNVPFVFATGYSDRSIIPASFDAPVVRKPYEAAALIGAVMKVLEDKKTAPSQQS